MLWLFIMEQGAASTGPAVPDTDTPSLGPCLTQHQALLRARPLPLGSQPRLVQCNAGEWHCRVSLQEILLPGIDVHSAGNDD